MSRDLILCDKCTNYARSFLCPKCLTTHAPVDAPRWQKTPPTVPGNYWTRIAGSKHGARVSYYTADDLAYYASDWPLVAVEWQPVAPPVESEDA